MPLSAKLTSLANAVGYAVCGGDASGGSGDGMTLLNARRAYHGHINYSIKGVKKSLKYLCVTPLSK